MKRTLILLLSLILLMSLFACTNERVVEEYEPETTIEASDQTEILSKLIVALDEEKSNPIPNVKETAVPLDEGILEDVDHGIGVTNETHITEFSKFITTYDRYKELSSYVLSEPREEKDQEAYDIIIYDLKDKSSKKVVFQLKYTMTYNKKYCSEISIKLNIDPTRKHREHFDKLVECITHSYAGLAVEFLSWEGQIGLNVNALINNGVSLDKHIELVKTYEDGRTVALLKSAKTNQE